MSGARREPRWTTIKVSQSSRLTAFCNIEYKGWNFNSRWKGYREEDEPWEPLSKFFHRYSSDLVKYAQEHGLSHLPVLQVLRAEPDQVDLPRPKPGAARQAPPWEKREGRSVAKAGRRCQNTRE